MVNVEDTVEVVDFVLQRARKKATSRNYLGTIVGVQILTSYLRCTREGSSHVRKAETALLVALTALLGDDFRIEKNERHLNRRIEQLVFGLVAAFWNVDDAHLLKVPDLLGGEANALRRMHGLDHVLRKLAQIVVDNRHWRRLFTQHLLAVLIDFQFQISNLRFQISNFKRNHKQQTSNATTQQTSNFKRNHKQQMSNLKHQTPVEPKPPEPRSVSSTTSVSSMLGCVTGAMTI